MTKKEQARREAVIKRSNKAIAQLNDKKDLKKRVKRFNKKFKKLLKEEKSDLDLLKSYLDGQGFPYAMEHKDITYTFITINFDDDGNVI